MKKKNTNKKWNVRDPQFEGYKILLLNRCIMNRTRETIPDDLIHTSPELSTIPNSEGKLYHRPIHVITAQCY